MSRTHPPQARFRWVVAIVQVALLIGVVAGATHRFTQLQQRSKLPPLRERPLAIHPEYDNPAVVTDEQVRRVLQKLVPRNRSAETTINHVDHALRFWGVEATFEDPELFSGEQIRRLLTDHGHFVELYGADGRPLLMDEPPGVRVRVQEGSASSSHVDHTLATLAEVGTPLSFPVRTPTRQTTFGAILRQSLRDFSLNQVEYEWSAITYALFLRRGWWVSEEGQTLTFDRLARRIMRQEMPQGVCYGNHRLYALVILLRVDALPGQDPILSPAGRREIKAYLQDMTRLLVRHQHADGFWNSDWPHEVPASREPSEGEGDRLAARILATGHALEWWALAPPQLHPPRHVLVSAGQWLVTTIDGLTEDQVQEYYTFLTHAGRSLAIWRANSPASLDLADPSLNGR